MIAVQTNSVQRIEENALTGSEIPVSEGQCMSRLSRFFKIGAGKITTVSRGYFTSRSRHLGFVGMLQVLRLCSSNATGSRHLDLIGILQ